MAYFMQTKKYILFITLIFLLLFLDVAQFFLLGTIALPLLLCLYGALLAFPIKHKILICIALLQCLEFFCFYNFFSLPFIYLIPMTMLGIYFKKHLYPSFIHPALFACIGAMIQIYSIEGPFILLNMPNAYTIMRIGAIITITVCFSLTLQSWGMQDNRS